MHIHSGGLAIPILVASFLTFAFALLWDAARRLRDGARATLRDWHIIRGITAELRERARSEYGAVISTGPEPCIRSIHMAFAGRTEEHLRTRRAEAARRIANRAITLLSCAGIAALLACNWRLLTS